MWVLTKASGSFVRKFQVYTGKRQDGLAEQNLGYHVVHDFSQNLTVKSHHDFSTTFSQLSSLQKIFWRTVSILVHLREQTARNLSQTIAIDLAYKARRGSLSQRNNVVATVWKDKKVFHFISTQSNPVRNETVNRIECDRTIIHKQCSYCKKLLEKGKN